MSVPPIRAGGVGLAFRFVGIGANSCQPIELPADVLLLSAGTGADVLVAW